MRLRISFFGYLTIEYIRWILAIKQATYETSKGSQSHNTHLEANKVSASYVRD